MKLCIPEKILNQHVAVLGKTGAGKSSALRHVVEHLLNHKKRVCIIDPKGDWWGLKKSADGKSVGYDVIAFGDFKEAKATDIPLNEKSGKHVAELIASGNRPCIIGFRGWMTGAMVRFWIDFASTIFNANSGELYLVGDEFHNFAPKGKIMDPEAGKCLHWSNRLLSEGRGYGLVCLIASQRPQKVHNDTLTCCETLVAMRVIHKADRDAAQDWIEGCGDMAVGREVLNSLAGMARGEAYVWSPEIGFGPERVVFPMFETFDSFAPPQLQKKVSDSGWSAVNLDLVRQKMADVIKESVENDPTILKRQIADLKKQLAAKPVETKEIEKLVLKDSQITAIEKIVEQLNDLNFKAGTLWDMFHAQSADVLRAIRTVKPLPKFSSLAPKPSFVVTKPAMKAGTHAANVPLNGSLPEGERKVLTAAAQYDGGVSRDQLGVLTGYKRSTRDAYIARLKERGYVDQSGENVIATEEGFAALGPDFEPLPTGEALIEYWRQRLPHGERIIWELALKSYPDSISREDLEAPTGFKRSTRDAYISRSIARKVLEAVGPGEIKASDTFFA